MTGRGSARGVDELLSTFGPAPPRQPAPAPQPPRERVNRPAAPRRGRRAPGAGWSPVEAPLAVYRITTDQVGGLFPLVAASGVPPSGARIGYDTLSGAPFYADPIGWTSRLGITPNPNLIMFGEPGLGKSGTVLALALRLMPFGVKTLIAGDLKGEYSPLVRALGVEPIALGPGLGTRLNPLDLGPLAARWREFTAAQQREEIHTVLGRWVGLLTALCEAQGYRTSNTDEVVLSSILRQLIGVADASSDLRPVTVPDVHRLLADPDAELWTEARFADRQQFLDHTRGLTDTLGALIHGPLAGLFDAPTSFSLDWSAPIQSMDIERLRARGDQAVGIALTILGTWSAMATDLLARGQAHLVVRDEVWRQMRLGLHAVQAIDSELRLSRLEQRIPLLVAHKPSDLLTVGAAGSPEVAIARDLISLCATRILSGQSAAVSDELAESLGLSEAGHRQITQWATAGKGRALWVVGGTEHKVQTVRTTVERKLHDTNAALRAE